jgi:hypothetical protein
MKQIWWIILRTLGKWRLLFKELMTDLVEKFGQNFCEKILVPPL